MSELVFINARPGHLDRNAQIIGRRGSLLVVGKTPLISVNRCVHQSDSETWHSVWKTPRPLHLTSIRPLVGKNERGRQAPAQLYSADLGLGLKVMEKFRWDAQNPVRKTKRTMECGIHESLNQLGERHADRWERGGGVLVGEI